MLPEEAGKNREILRKIARDIGDMYEPEIGVVKLIGREVQTEDEDAQITPYLFCRSLSEIAKVLTHGEEESVCGRCGLLHEECLEEVIGLLD